MNKVAPVYLLAVYAEIGKPKLFHPCAVAHLVGGKIQLDEESAMCVCNSPFLFFPLSIPSTAVTSVVHNSTEKKLSRFYYMTSLSQKHLFAFLLGSLQLIKFCLPNTVTMSFPVAVIVLFKSHTFVTIT